MARVAQVHRLERQGHLEKLAQLRDGALVVLAAARNREHDVVVVEALRVAEAMQGVGHGLTASNGAAAAAGFVTRPRPMLVFARSSW